MSTDPYSPKAGDKILLLLLALIVVSAAYGGVWHDPELEPAPGAPAVLAAADGTQPPPNPDTTDGASLEGEVTMDTDELLCLTQIVYSESSRDTSLQRRVAWATKLRKESGYRGKDSYCEIRDDPWQYSAFRPDWDMKQSEISWKYELLNRSLRFPGENWQEAKTIARRIALEPKENNIFAPVIRRKGLDVNPNHVRHFAAKTVQNHWTEHPETVEVFRDHHFVYYVSS